MGDKEKFSKSTMRLKPASSSVGAKLQVYTKLVRENISFRI